MKLKLTSDGTPSGTKLVFIDADGVEQNVEHIVKIGWGVSVDGLAACEVTLKAVPCEVEASQAQFTFWHPTREPQGSES